MGITIIMIRPFYRQNGNLCFHPLHPIDSSRGTGAETCGLDGVFPRHNICSRPEALF